VSLCFDEASDKRVDRALAQVFQATVLDDFALAHQH
jgi:hypothetical protein